MYKVICIIGKSGTGKSTLASELCKNDKFHFIKSFTTRAVRKNDSEDIKTHTFVSFKERINTEEKDILLEYANEQKHYSSWVTKELFKKDKINVFVVDIDSFIKFSKMKDFDIKCVYLSLLEEERRNRYRKRESEFIQVPKDKHLSLEYLMVRALNMPKDVINIININEKTPSQIKDDVLISLGTFTQI